MRKRLESGVGECRTVVEAQFERVLRDEGYKVYKPDFPKYLTISPKGEVIFVEGLRIGERLGKRKKIALALLARMGFKVELLYQVRRMGRDTVVRSFIRDGKIAIPRVMPPVMKFEPFTIQTEKDEMTEQEKKREREYQEMQEILGTPANDEK